ncbi:MAG: CsgG/HfaB family protein [Dysgonamonadaceae bacterium]|nr:CsgG/HfaB family protein [Dysgonamonadaceae bacterium]
MKKVILSFCLLAVAAAFVEHPVKAQEDEKQRVAVFDPTSAGASIDEGIVVAVRELISSALVNSGKYNMVERSLLDKVMKEQKFSNSGAVDASQVSELGKLAGANKAVVSVLTAAGKRYMASLKMIDIETASVVNQKIKTLESADEFLDVVENLALEMIGETPLEAAKAGDVKKPAARKQTIEKPDVEKSAKETFAERNNEDIFFDSSPSAKGKSVELKFTGAKSGKNPSVQLFLDGKLVGDGTLNQGFIIQFKDANPGARTLKVKWSGTVSSKSFNINTAVKNYYEFEYGTTGFGYVFKIKE